MKVVILAGGLGSRISEESVDKPKPMIEIGGKPILWHIMKIYSHYGFNDFIICCGYKGYMIKEYFANYFIHNSDVTYDINNNEIHIHEKFVEPWKVTLVDTGQNTMTGGRLKRVSKYLELCENFCFTYGDGVSSVNINNLVEFHINHNKLATLTAVQPPGRFGSLNLSDNRVNFFQEKPQGDGGWINGGFFVLSKKVLEYISDDGCIWEKDPLEKLSLEGNLMAYFHNGFWMPMDTLRDKNYLNEIYIKNSAPWRKW